MIGVGAFRIIVLGDTRPPPPEAQAATVNTVQAVSVLLLLRVADAAPTLRFRYTLAVDRVVNALRGRGWARLHSRPAAAWRAELESLGFSVEAVPMSAGTPFANVLLAARYDVA